MTLPLSTEAALDALETAASIGAPAMGLFTVADLANRAGINRHRTRRLLAILEAQGRMARTRSGLGPILWERTIPEVDIAELEASWEAPPFSG